METELRNITRIVENVVGEPRREWDVDGWNECNCVYCCDFDGVKNDRKYNLCINFMEGYFHCWKCGTSGKISRLIKDYGGQGLLGEYYDELRAIKNSQQYVLQKGNSYIDKELFSNESIVALPDNYKPITKEDRKSYPAYLYLKQRGIDYDLINEYKIGYVGWGDDYKMRTRVIIPSYNEYGQLNYYVGRDYSGKQSMKYCNPDIKKTKFIFNEEKINWYEDVVLVEGVFDSIGVPNSIPLLGKSLNREHVLFNTLMEKAQAKVVILLDDDAIDDAKKMYAELDNGKLRGRVRFIECPKGYDAALIFEKFGKRGVYRLLQLARQLKEYELL